MKEITDVNVIKELELGVLIEIHNFCVKHNLQYFLACGTLIGAIRHNGFIPWDDDIDIMMKRKDYDFFIHHFGNDRYGVNSCTTNKNYYWSYAKAYDKHTLKIENKKSYKLNQGVDVDIFVLNDCCDIDFAKRKEKKRRILQVLWSFSIRDWKKVTSFKCFIANLVSVFLRPLSNHLAKKMNRLTLMDKNQSDVCNHYQIFSLVGNRIHIMEKEWFSKQIPHKFEKYYFFIPVGYDQVLKEEFGDYMKLPPIEQRVSHHSNRVFYIEDEK
ncbi:MAG: LicD family protein [Erysipelotrichaceae bacterium]|nr:LicD family protein [Erysipelotrichaceae bacterium]